MEEILLINPPRSKDWQHDPNCTVSTPFSILLIASVLKEAGLKVRLFDAHIREDPYRDLEDHLSRNRGRILIAGITCMSTQVFSTKRVCELIKTSFPEIRVVLGGIHPTLYPESTARYELADFVAVGEGEYTMLELCRKLSAGDENFDEVDGLIYKAGGVTRTTKPREASDVDALPELRYDLLEELPRYWGSGEFARFEEVRDDVKNGSFRQLSVITGLGCPYKCTFCINPILAKRYRHRSTAAIIAEIKNLVRQHGVKCVGFIDENFFVSKNRVVEMLDALRRESLGILWHTNLRANYFREDYLTADFLARVRESGGAYFGVGAESGSQRVLDKIRKGIAVADIGNAAEKLCQSNMRAAFSFMIGLPSETEEEQNSTLALCLEIANRYRNISVIGPQVFRPYPGSPLFEEAVSCGMELPSTFEEWGDFSDFYEGNSLIYQAPWIEDHGALHRKLFYFYFATKVDHRKEGNPLRKLALFVLNRLAQFRVRHSWFALPFEFLLLKNKVKIL